MAGTQEPAEEGDPSAGSCVLWRADDPEDDDLTHVQVTCLVYAQAHLVNPKTGKAGHSADIEEATSDDQNKCDEKNGPIGHASGAILSRWLNAGQRRMVSECDAFTAGVSLRHHKFTFQTLAPNLAVYSYRPGGATIASRGLTCRR